MDVALPSPGLCPVCRSWSGAAPCRVCHWDPAAGPAPDARVRERAAAARWDLAAARLAARSGPPHGPAPAADPLPPPLRNLVRRSPARSAADPLDDGTVHVGDRPGGDPQEWAGAVSVLTALAAGEADAVHVLTVSPAGAAVKVLVQDRDGGLCAREDGELRIGWGEVAPWLPGPSPHRDFLLAGGIGARPPYGVDGVPRAADEAWEQPVARAADAVLAGLRAERARGALAPLVVVGRAGGWRWPDLLLRTVEQQAPASARVLLAHDDPRTPEAVVPALCRRVPLRHGYALLAHRPDGRAPHDRGVAPVPLFPSGTVLPDEGELTATVRLLAPPAEHTSSYALPLVIAKGPSPQEWVVVRTGRTPVRPGRPTDVTVVLDRSGAVRFAAPDDVAESDFEPGALDADPDPDPESAPHTDLLLLVELGGTRDDLARRTGLLREVLLGLGPSWPVSGRLAVGIIGYSGHFFHPARSGRTDGDDPLHFRGPFPADEAAGELGTLRASGAGHTFAAPLEDALAAAAGSPMWRPRTRRVVVVLGGRPPHPARQGRDQALPCPHGLDWRPALHDLRSRLRCQVVAVHDPVAWSDAWRTQSVQQLRDAWRELGRQHSVVLDPHAPERVLAGVHAAAGTRAPAPRLLVDARGGDTFGTWHSPEGDGS